MTCSSSGIHALLLDLDGTVADTPELIYEGLVEATQTQLGVDFPRELWEQHVGLPLADLFSLVCGGESSSHVSVELLIHSYRAQQERNEHRIRAYPGMASVLETLRQRDVRLAIVTTKLHAIARRHLNAIGLLDCFDVIVGFDDCARAKPDAEPFLRALRGLGVDPAEAAAVGDSPLDIQGARAAGVVAVAAMWGAINPAALLAAQPDRTLAAPDDLLRLVDGSL